MYENIIYQKNVTESLSHDLKNETLPRSLLFCGDQYSGKASCALETARLLSCTGNRKWNCACIHCRQHRELLHADLLMLGKRPFITEIIRASELLERFPEEPSARFMWLRSVRKLLRRFDSRLWQDEESRLKKISAPLDECYSLIEEVPDGKNRKKILGCCEKINAAVPDSIPIHQIRNIIGWSHIRADGVKTIVMENCDSMLPAARNAMLKLLEEPPKNLYLILTATRQDLIIPTLLSRLRPYAFRRRSGEEQNEIIRKLFRTEQGTSHGSLHRFFLGEETLSLVRSLAEEFIENAANGGMLPPVGNNDFELFARELSEVIAKRIRLENSRLQQNRYSYFSEGLRRALISRKVYNIAPDSLLHSLFGALKNYDNLPTSGVLY